MPTKTKTSTPANGAASAKTKTSTSKTRPKAAKPRPSKKLVALDAARVYYRDLNNRIKRNVSRGAWNFRVDNVNGQRYIGTGITVPANIELIGTAGNDLGAFMGGPVITVRGNVQDGCGNTMNSGEVIVHGHAGDIAGFGMRGGKIFIRSDVGYRVGIHMKEYRGKKPTLVVGGTSQDFFGEYMAGGVLVLLGLTLAPGEMHHGDFIGTGMHGGVMYIRGPTRRSHLGKEVGEVPLEDADKEFLRGISEEFARHFGEDYTERLGLKRPFTADDIVGDYSSFIKLIPVSLRPYGRLYAY